MPGPVFGAEDAKEKVFVFRCILGQGVLGGINANHFRTMMGTVMGVHLGCCGSTKEGHLFYPFLSLGEATLELSCEAHVGVNKGEE